MLSRSFHSRALLVLTLLSLVALPAAALEDVLYQGVDLWATPDGGSLVDFTEDPIPADFFCPGSQPFQDRVMLTGVPLVTADGSLRTTDTIMRRLDDAVFGVDGVAETRLQIAALSLKSMEPVQTRCGTYDVWVSLADGPQPITTMRIYRTYEFGGYFITPLALKASITFLPARDTTALGLAEAGSGPLELVRELYFPADGDGNHKWAYRSLVDGFEHPSPLQVRIGRPGAEELLTLPGTSNFAAGWGIPRDKAMNGGLSLENLVLEFSMTTTHHEVGGGG